MNSEIKQITLGNKKEITIKMMVCAASSEEQGDQLSDERLENIQSLFKQEATAPVSILADNQRAWTQPDPEKGALNRLHPRWSPDGKQMLYTESDWSVGISRYIIRNIDDDSTQILEIPDNWAPFSVDWMDENRSVLFSAYDFNKREARPLVTEIYKYDISSGEITQLTNGSHARWVSDDVFSVSPASKHPVRWGELKKAYLD